MEQPRAGSGIGAEYFRNRPYRLLWTGQSISSLGDWVATFGLMLFVQQLTKSSKYQGLAISGILGFRILPALIAAPIASSVADRFDRRATMISMDLARAALITGVPFVHRLGGLYAIAFFLEGLGLIFLPARDAVVPNLVERDKLAGANALIMLTQWGTIPIAGGLVVAADAAARAMVHVPVMGALAGAHLALPFFFDAVTFLVSAWAILNLPSRLGKVARDPAMLHDHNPLHAMQTDIGQGTRYLLRDRGLRGLTLGMALATGGGGALFSLGIPYVKTTLGASNSIFGALIAIWGLGMAIGGWLSQRARRRESDLFRLGLGGCGCVLVVMGLVPHVWLALLLAAGFGTGLSIALVLGITLAQSTAPPDLRGRVMAAVHVLARIFLILGAVVVGGVAAALNRSNIIGGWDGNRYAMLLAGITMMGGGVAAKGGARRIEQRKPS